MPAAAAAATASKEEGRVSEQGMAVKV